MNNGIVIYEKIHILKPTKTIKESKERNKYNREIERINNITKLTLEENSGITYQIKDINTHIKRLSKNVEDRIEKILLSIEAIKEQINEYPNVIQYKSILSAKYESYKSLKEVKRELDEMKPKINAIMQSDMNAKISESVSMELHKLETEYIKQIKEI